MTPDLWAIVATLVLAMVQLSMQSIAMVRQAGGAWVAGPREVAFEPTGLTGRIVRAHRNLLEIIPQFFAAVFVVHLADANGSLSLVGAWVFVLGRVLYVPAYLWAPNGVRPICWQIGQLGILIVLADLFY